jgi:hypothetical protein
MTFSLRKATLDDRPILEGLIAESARGLSRQDYTDVQAGFGLHWPDRMKLSAWRVA